MKKLKDGDSIVITWLPDCKTVVENPRVGLIGKVSIVDNYNFIVIFPERQKAEVNVNRCKFDYAIL